MTGEYDIAMLNTGLDMLYEALMSNKTRPQCLHFCQGKGTHFLKTHNRDDTAFCEEIEQAIEDGSLPCGECR